MKAYVLIICAVFLCNLAFGKVSKTDTGLYKQFTIIFHKVTPSFEEANKAKLIIQYIDSNKLFNIKFIVPNYCYRYKTTLNDYFIIQTKKGSYRFDNQVNSLPENNNQIFYVMVIGKYIFETNIKSDALKEIFCRIVYNNSYRSRLIYNSWWTGFDKVGYFQARSNVGMSTRLKPGPKG